jgi:cytochrome c-type biogenesis protein CcmF
LVAAATNKVVSVNSSGMIPVKDFEKVNKSGENLMLYQNEPVKMDKYTITYLSDSTEGPNTYYKVNYKVVDEKSGKVTEEFNLYPNAQQNPKMGLIASPDTKHYITYDVYTHISAAPQLEPEHEEHEGHSEDENYQAPITRAVNIGDTINLNDGYVRVKAVNRNASIENIKVGNGDVAVGMDLEVISGGKTYTSTPIFLLKSGVKYDFGKKVEEVGLKFRFTDIKPADNKLELMVYQKPPAPKKWIVLKAIAFPYINFFWGGTIIMVVGFLLSIFRRSKEVKVA